MLVSASRRTLAALLIASVIGGVIGSATPSVAAHGAEATASSQSLPTAAEPAATSVDRISGSDRYGTSVAASRAAFPEGTTPEVVYLVTGADYPDAVAAGPVAAAAGAGLLLTAPDRLPASVASELRRLGPERIVLVGGTSAISSGVANSAATIAPVTRIAGADRYSTAERLVRSVFAGPSGSGATHVYVATGASFPDALTAGPAAAIADSPVVLVRGDRSTLTPSALTLLTELGASTVTIVGGTSVISSGIERQLRGLFGDDSVERTGGADRYATALAVNSSAFGAASGRVFIASGTGYADALAVAVFAAQQERPLYLSLPYCAPSAMRTALGDVEQLTLVGGPAALSPGVGRLERCLSIDSASSLWVLVNKRNSLPSNYAPSGLRSPSIPNVGTQYLRSVAASALEDMVTAARSEGAGRIGITSGYRSYASQRSIYNQSLQSRGYATTELYVARPGHSEHQTGLAADLYPIGAPNCSNYRCLGDTVQGRWLRDNAWRFGFILRYEPSQTSITGYGYESWHFRYVGPTLAADYEASGHRTFEQFLGQRAAPSY